MMSMRNVILHVWRDKEFLFLKRTSDIKDVASEHPRKQTNKSFAACEHIDGEHTSAPQTPQQEITDSAVQHCCCRHEIQKLIAVFLNLSCGEKCSSHFMPLSGSGTTPLFHFLWFEGSWNGFSRDVRQNKNDGFNLMLWKVYCLCCASGKPGRWTEDTVSMTDYWLRLIIRVDILADCWWN